MIQEHLTQLYKNYPNKHPRFVPCGLVNETEYLKSRTKTLWLLKEPNDPEPENPEEWKTWDLTEQVRVNIKEKKWSGRLMWKVIGALTYGMQQVDYPPYRGAYDNIDNVCTGLEMIAVTNLKKDGGGSSSKDAEISAAAINEKELWIEEIRIINPDIIICGATFWYINKILSLNSIPLEVGSYYAKYDTGERQIIILSMHHPAYRVSVPLVYSFVKDCVEELRSKKLVP